MAEAKYKIRENDLGWYVATVSKESDDGWYFWAGPFSRLEDAEEYLRDFVNKIAESEQKKEQRERASRYYDKQGYPAAFSGVGSAGVQYDTRRARKGYGAGGCE